MYKRQPQRSVPRDSFEFVQGPHPSDVADDDVYEDDYYDEDVVVIVDDDDPYRFDEDQEEEEYQDVPAPDGHVDPEEDIVPEVELDPDSIQFKELVAWVHFFCPNARSFKIENLLFLQKRRAFSFPLKSVQNLVIDSPCLNVLTESVLRSWTLFRKLLKIQTRTFLEFSVMVGVFISSLMKRVCIALLNPILIYLVFCRPRSLRGLDFV